MTKPTTRKSVGKSTTGNKRLGSASSNTRFSKAKESRFKHNHPEIRSNQRVNSPNKVSAACKKSRSVNQRTPATETKLAEAEVSVNQEHIAHFAAPIDLGVGQEYRTPVVTLTMTEDEVERRIDNFLISILPHIPKSTFYKLLRKGEIRVNKGRIKPEYKLQLGDQVRIAPLTLTKRESNDLKLSEVVTLQNIQNLANRIVYEDDYFIVMNKPIGIAVHGGSGLSYGMIEALRILLPHEKKLELVHRLDKDTSGLLLISKSPRVLKQLQEMFRNKTIRKSYFAFMPGVWTQPKIDAPLQRYEKNGERFVEVAESGKESVTKYRLLQRYQDNQGQDFSLVVASPLTGRTHQIRVHSLHGLAALAGDVKYSSLYEQDYFRKLGLKRMFLQAFKLEFVHPITEQPLVIEVELDPELQQFLAKLTKIN